jgi:hypothetical protein
VEGVGKKYRRKERLRYWFAWNNGKEEGGEE